MSNTFDMVNNALMRQLERLDELDVRKPNWKDEVARAKALRDVCATAVDNANAATAAVNMVRSVTGSTVDVSAMPRLLGRAEDDA